MEGQKLWRVFIRYNGNSGFDYLSDCPDMPLAVAAATRKLFVKNIAVTPKESRIDSVTVTRLSRQEVPDHENIISESQG